MAYSKQTWTNGPDGGTPLSAARLNHIEDGIEAAAETADDALPKSGGTLTGDLTLSGAPTSDLHAATKKYVDDAADLLLPLAGGTVTGDLSVGGALDVTGRLTAAGFALPVLAPSNPAYRWRDVSSIVSLFQSGHGWSTSGTPGSSELNDTATFVRGTQSARITTGGSGVNCGIQRLGMGAIDLTGKAIRLVFRLDDASVIGNLNFFVGTSSLANNFKWRFDAETNSSKIAKDGEWVVVTLQWSEVNLAGGSFSLSSTGVPSTTSGFTDMRFEVSDNSSGALTVNLQAVEIIDAPTTAYPNGLVSIVFDDSWDSQWTLARPVMDTYGFRGSNYTIVEAVGTSNHVTLDQLKALQNISGWEIGGHSYAAAAHTNRYPNMTAEAVDDDLRNLRSWLLSNGFYGDTFAYPGGQFEDTTDGVPVDDLVARYFSAGRTILSATGTATHTAIDAVPAAMPYRLRGMSSVSSLQVGPNNPDSLIAEGGMLDKVAENSGWLTLVFHRIVEGTPADSTQCSAEDFESIIDGIASRSMTVLPISEVVNAGAPTS